MSVSSTNVDISYIADGVAVSFAYPNYFLTASDLLVSVNGATQLLNTNYSIVGTGGNVSPDPFGAYPGGANIVFVVAPATGSIIRITRSTAKFQPLVLQPSGPFPSGLVNQEFDRLTLLIQEIASGFVGDLGSGPPTSGNYAAGQWGWTKANWVAGGYMGVLCVAAGNPGTWLPFGNISLP